LYFPDLVGDNVVILGLGPEGFLKTYGGDPINLGGGPLWIVEATAVVRVLAALLNWPAKRGSNPCLRPPRAFVMVERS